MANRPTPRDGWTAVSAQSKAESSAAAVSARPAAPTRGRAPGLSQKTLIGVAAAPSQALFPAEQASAKARRGGREVREDTQEVSLCDTLPASESIVAALANIAEPTHDISLHELSASSPGVANDVQADGALHDASGAPSPQRGRSTRWFWALVALSLLITASFFWSRLPIVANTQRHAARSEPSVAAVSAQASSPAATQPSVEAIDEPSVDQAVEAVETDEHAQLGLAAALARADELAAQGSALRKRRKLGPARSKYRSALQTYPGHPRALYGLVQLAMQQHDGKQAVELALELVQAQPDQASYALLLGDAYRAAGKTKEARAAWQDAARQGNALARKRLK